MSSRYLFAEVSYGLDAERWSRGGTTALQMQKMNWCRLAPSFARNKANGQLKCSFAEYQEGEDKPYLRTLEISGGHFRKQLKRNGSHSFITADRGQSTWSHTCEC